MSSLFMRTELYSERRVLPQKAQKASGERTIQSPSRSFLCEAFDHL